MLAFKAIWERENRGLISSVHQLEVVTRVFPLKNNAQPAKPNLFLKNGNEGTDDSATHGSVAVPLGRDRKIWTALSNH